jgi:hypothetical protein
MYTLAKTIYRMTDMGELAGRLGSIVTHDRRGDVIWLDDFEGGVEKWDFLGSGTGYAHAWSAERSRSGAFCCKLTTGSDSNKYITMTHRNPYPVKSKIGFEFSGAWDDLTGEVIFQVELFDGATQYTSRIRMDLANLKFYYLDGVAGYTEFYDAALFDEDDHLFNTFKLVADFENELYSRLIINNTAFDLSSYPIYKTAAATLPYLNAYVWLITDLAENKVAWIDDVILTQNEP